MSTQPALLKLIVPDPLCNSKNHITKITYDLERQMEGATKLSTSEFGDKIIENM